LQKRGTFGEGRNIQEKMLHDLDTPTGWAPMLHEVFILPCPQGLGGIQTWKEPDRSTEGRNGKE
jgi:hypothetical protein